jgi:hypothetical protein
LTDLRLKFYQAGWIPHQLSEPQKVDRVTLLQGMFQKRKDSGPKQHKYLMMGNESWIF